MRLGQITMLILFIYLAFVLSVAVMWDVELQQQFLCGYYKRFYLPFPIIETSGMSVWWGGPTKILVKNLIIDLLIPMMLYTVSSFVDRFKEI